MKCESCEKRDATVHLTEIKKGVKQEMHLCEQCAAEKGLPGKSHFSISELLAGITTESSKEISTDKGSKGREISCKHCEQTLSQFQSSGRFGCPECYESFKEEILPLVQKIHDSAQHLGRVPKHASKDVSIQTEVRQLQLELKRAIRAENFERAAEIRDRVSQLEASLKESPSTSGGTEDNPAPKAKKRRTKKEDKES